MIGNSKPKPERNLGARHKIWTKVVLSLESMPYMRSIVLGINVVPIITLSILINSFYSTPYIPCITAPITQGIIPYAISLPLT